MLSLPFLVWTTIPVLFLAVAWQVLDASPALWIYDGVSRLFPVVDASVLSPASLSNETIWITGASSGIGAAVVCELAQHQHPPQHVILSARNVEKMQRVVQDCQQQLSSTTFSVIPYDALNAEMTSTVVQQAMESSPKKSIDILVLNSGIYQVQPALETSAEYRRKLFRVNVEAPMELSQALMQQDDWKGRGHGHIVVVSSVMAKGPHSLSSTYAATKAALKSYFQSLSCEEWPWLKVTSVLPGATETDLWKNLESQHVRPDHRGSAMTPQRVALLMVRTMAATHSSSMWAWWCFHEVWISKNIGLVYACMSHYTPTLFYVVNHMIGLARLEAWNEHHKDMLEVFALIKTTLKLILKKWVA